jgi:protein-disulfide isomerase
MKNTKTLVLALFALVTAGFLAFSIWYKKSEANKHVEEVMQKQAALIRPHSVILGPENAKVTLVEFLDPECESCRAFYPFVKQLMAKHPNDIRLVIRYAPFHPNSRFAIKILEAARLQNRYWETLGTLFYYQPSWGDHHNPKPELIWDYLHQAEVDIEQIKKDMHKPEFDKIIEQDSLDLADLGVKATPTFFINGQPLKEFGFEQLQQAVEEQLESN